MKAFIKKLCVIFLILGTCVPVMAQTQLTNLPTKYISDRAALLTTGFASTASVESTSAWASDIDMFQLTSGGSDLDLNSKNLPVLSSDDASNETWYYIRFKTGGHVIQDMGENVNVLTKDLNENEAAQLWKFVAVTNPTGDYKYVIKGKSGRTISHVSSSATSDGFFQTTKNTATMSKFSIVATTHSSSTPAWELYRQGANNRHVNQYQNSNAGARISEWTANDGNNPLVFVKAKVTEEQKPADQLPKISSDDASNETWYRIRFKNGNHVIQDMGENVNVLTKDMNENESAQLWKFVAVTNPTGDFKYVIKGKSGRTISHVSSSETSDGFFQTTRNTATMSKFSIVATTNSTYAPAWELYRQGANNRHVNQFQNSNANARISEWTANDGNNPLVFEKVEVSGGGTTDPKPDDKLPTISTSANPIWYYVQVQGGSDNRANLVFTADNDGVRIFGKTMLTSGSASEIDKQLWRFEQSGNNYIIINKATGKKLTTSYNSSKGISVTALNASSSTTWQFESSIDNYFNIKASAAPSGGSSSAVYTHQANNYDSRNYVIMLESSSYNNTENSRFRFVLYQSAGTNPSKDPEIELSDNNKTIWYSIASANPNYPGKVITDITANGNTNIKFSIETLSADNEYQQWKVVKKTTNANDKRVDLINRATGRVISTSSVFQMPFYHVQYTPNQNGSNGWTINYIGDDQFEISGLENDGSTRYLNATSKNEELLEFYIEGLSKETGFAWKFIEMAALRSSSSYANMKDALPVNVLIYVKDRQIIVEGADDYVVRTIQGMMVEKRKIQLPVGIYLVTVNGKTTKVLVH